MTVAEICSCLVSGAIYLKVSLLYIGLGYKWEDDFPLLPLPTSSAKANSPPPRSTLRAPAPKPAVQYSRFSVSPSAVSRFSITNISDSDVDSVGGESLKPSPRQNMRSRSDFRILRLFFFSFCMDLNKKQNNY